MARVLIIDDDRVFCQMLSKIVRGLGQEVASSFTLKDGLHQSLSCAFDVVFLDVGLPDGNGLEALPRIREMAEAPEVIIITGSGGPDGPEAALKNGAWDYLEKPATTKEMTLSLVRALQYRQEKKAPGPPVSLKREGIVGDSARLRACLDLLAQAAASDAPVLIKGETGTGKELFAAAIHHNSRRAPKNFVVVDCTALPESLVESTLFGYEKGAFTGADQTREGLVKHADHGTLFLDEVGELPLSLQKTFLRVLEVHRFRPLGSKKEITSDFRLVAATNRDLQKMVRAGQFRQDLLFRLQALTLELPPLRKRPEDIKPLAMFYLERLCARYRIGLKGLTPEFLGTLQAYDWPGNVRELINALESALAAAQDELTLFPQHLPLNIRLKMAQIKIGKEAESAVRDQGAPYLESFPNLRVFREAMDMEYLRALLYRTSGNISQACKISGLSRSSFYELLKRHNP
ncbi:MAG: sigma-54 dependent transcriptional regulator [Thermodesulfobacteriota bacterium]